MNPQERDLINGLFDRLRQAEGQPRDAEAEALIRDRMSQQSAAAYALCQTAIVQEHTITALQTRVHELEASLAQPAPQQGGGGFLSGLFGGGAPARPAAPQPVPQAAPAAGPWGGAPQAQPAPSGPWGNAAAPQAPAAGGGFLATAVTTAAGVAGGMLVANAISGMFSGHGGGSASQSLFGGASNPFGGNNSGSGNSNDAFSQIQPGGSAPSQSASGSAYDSGGSYDSADDGDTFDSGFDDSSDYA